MQKMASRIYVLKIKTKMDWYGYNNIVPLSNTAKSPVIILKFPTVLSASQPACHKTQ